MRVSRKRGLSPGSLVYIGDEKHESVSISVMDYNAEHLTELADVPIESVARYKNTDTVTWIDVSGVHDTAVIEQVGHAFGLHRLVQEDLLNTEQRPKMEDHDDYIFVVLKMMDYREADDLLLHEQVSMIILPGVVISFQERTGDVFGPVRERIRKGKGRIRRFGSDYLAYALMDMIVDQYFHILGVMEEEIERIQERVVSQPTPETLESIQTLKHEILFMRKAIWPVREIISGLLRGESDLLSKDVGIYLRDVHDHTVHILDTLETFRDLISGILDIYLSSVSQRMNEIMKLLTVIATLFIPLTFLAGIYGMNFTHMPELEWRFAYPAFWGVIILAVTGMLAWFRYKKWF